MLCAKSIKHVGVSDVYDITEIIGNGGYSSVVLGTHNTTQRQVAIKIVDRSKLNDELAERVRRECDINLRVKHPNIAQVFEIYESPDDICLVMELLKGGELFDLIASKGRLSEDAARPMFRAILDAVRYLHSLGIAHRDLKPENMLFTEDKNTVKLIDFGFAKAEHDSQSILQTPLGTPAYVAPEVINAESYNKNVDMWSMGCILYFMLCGRPPFYSDDDEETANLATRGQYTFPPGVSLSAEAKNLISLLLEHDPMRRLSAADALKHPWTAKGSSQREDVTMSDEEDSAQSEERRNTLRSSINRSIDTMRSETDKQTEQMEREQHEAVGLAAVQESPLWQRRQEKKRSMAAAKSNAADAPHK